RPGDACVARRRPGRSERPRRPVGHRGGDRDRGEPGHGKSWLRRVGDGPGRRGPRREPGHRQRGHHGAGRRPPRHAARPAVVAVPDRHDGGLPMRRPLLSLLLVLLAAARPAAAVCTAADVMACGSSCWTCSGSTCTLAKLLPVTRAACTFDFGARTLVLAGGGFTAGQNAFEIKARGLTVGTSGANGGTITLKSSGDTILGTTPGGGPLLVADANGDGTDAGEIDVAAGGQVRGNNGVTGLLRARGGTAAFLGDPGGTGGTFCI